MSTSLCWCLLALGVLVGPSLCLALAWPHPSEALDSDPPDEDGYTPLDALVSCTVVETGEVPGLVAISAGQEAGLRSGFACRFLRGHREVARGHVWFALERFASVRLAEGEPRVGDSALITLPRGG